MLRAVIYVRQSTAEQKDSRRVQEDEAKLYAKEIGATVVGVYSDDAISRAEYVKRPGLLSMLSTVRRGKALPYDVVILRDVDRLGGDTARNAVILSDLIDSGVEVHEYMSRNVVRMTSATDKMLSMMRNFAADIEREKTSARTRENHLNKARRGLVTGGSVYGYRNVRKDDGVHYEIEETEAEVVREIFRRYAAGDGLRTIAYDLNARHVPAPRTFWSQSSIQPMLRRERYVGRVVWGERRKAYRNGTKVRLAQKAEIVESRPHLRIVDQKLWNAVQAVIKRRAKLAVGNGTAPRPIRIPTTLGGFLQCGVCGGIVGVEKKVWGTPKPGEPRRSILVYYCQRHRRSGPTACSNSARRPVSIVDDLMAKWVRANIFSPEFVEGAMRDLRRRVEERRKSAVNDTKGWATKARKVKAELDRLTKALLSASAAPETVVRMIAEREEQLRHLDEKMLEAKRAPELVDRELARMAAVAKERIETMRTSWPWSPEAGRAFMETLLDGRLTVTPTADGRFKLAGRIVVSDCEPIDAEEGRPARLGKNRGLAKALETIEAEDFGITLRTKCVIPGRPRRDSNPC